MSEAGAPEDSTPRDRFRHLPGPIPPSELVEERPASPPPPFDGGRDLDTDAALRAGG